MAHKTHDPTDWPKGFGFANGVEATTPRRILEVAGQCATAPDGAPQHPGDMGAQIDLAIANVAATLDAAGMTLSDVVRIRVFSTDMGATLEHWGRVTGPLAAADCRPAATLVGVTALFAPDLMVEIEATAMA